LLEACGTWEALTMITLTIDPKLFPDAPAARQYVSDHRCIALFVRDLKRAGVAMSDRWFVSLEFHESGWVHYHLLVEAGYVDHRVAKRAWDKQGPQSEGWFGRLHVSKHFGNDIKHAVNYACKYVIKAPRHGMPPWALDLPVLRRYSSSRGLMPGEEVERCNGLEKPRKLLSIGKRMHSCGDPEKRGFEVLDARGILLDRAVMDPDRWILGEMDDLARRRDEQHLKAHFHKN